MRWARLFHAQQLRRNVIVEEAFSIPAKQIDGMDIRVVKAAASEAIDWCRSGKGPYLLEILTYRYRGHSMSDPAKYRSKEEVDRMREEHDPIEQVRLRLLADGVSEEELKRLMQACARLLLRPLNLQLQIKSLKSRNSLLTC